MRMQPVFVLGVALALAACSSARHSPSATDMTSVQSKKVAVGGLEAAPGANRMGGADNAPHAASEADSKDARSLADAPAPAGKAKAPAPEAKQREATAGLYIIRRGTLSMQVPHVRDAQQQVARLVMARHGFITDSRLEASDGGVPTATMTVRVPAVEFDGLLDSIGDVGSVRVRQVTGEDVTMEYVDTASRVRNLQKEEGQLLALLERSGKLSEILEVERELARVRGQIEQAQGRLRQLSSLVDLATLEVSLSEKVVTANASPWQLDASFQNAWRSAQLQLSSSLSGLVEEGVSFVVAVLPLLLMGFLAYLLAGWVLGLLLVSGLKLVSRTHFRRGWAAMGFVLLAASFPPLFGLLVMAALALAVGWGGLALYRRFVTPAS